MTLIKNKKGGMVLRDIVFMIIIFSGIIALSSVFVSNMATTYTNTNMTNEYNQDNLGEGNLSATAERWGEISRNLAGENGIPQLLKGTLQAAGEMMRQVILAPVTFSSMLTEILGDIGVSAELTSILKYILTGLLYGLIVFVIYSAFLKGGKL